MTESLKKKGLGINLLTVVIISIAGFIVIYFVIGRLTFHLNQGLQDEICRAQLFGAHSVIQGEYEGNIFNRAFDFTKKEAAKGMVKSPLCSTKNEIIDLRHITNQEDLNKEVGIYLGNMIRTCWSTFGEGKILNTFGQSQLRLSEFANNRFGVFYFPCYRVKFHMENYGDNVSISNLIDFPEGVLWRYNVYGRKISVDGNPVAKYFETNDREYLSYAGHVFLDGDGFIEFCEGVEASTPLTQTTREDFILRFRNWREIRDDLWEDIRNPFGTTRLQSMMILSAHCKGSLESIDSDFYYEVRYYSENYLGPDNSRDFPYNSIKIVKITAPDTQQITGTTER